MKYLKTLLVLILFGTAFVSCEKDEVSYAFQEISAPTNVTANFDVTQDDSGLVTVTPSGEGAESFKVYWGESANEDPEIVTPGGSLDHTYAEGEFKVRVVGVGSTNLTSEYQQMLTVSFSAPEELKVTIDQSSPNPNLIKVSATAVNATLFDVYFGDVEDEEPTQLMPDETIEYTYEATGDYTVRVVAKGAGAATLEYSEEITIAEASGTIALPITFDDPTVNYVENIDGAFSVVDNSSKGGSNDTDSKVGAIENAGDAYEAIVVNLGTPVDFASNKKITIKLYSTTAIPIAMKFEGGVDGERENEVVVQHGGTGWEDLTFDYATDATKSYIDGNQGVGEPFVPTGKYATMVIFVDFAGTTAGTFYIDDIEQENLNTTPLELPISFDDASVNYEGSIDGSFSVVDNPAPGGANNVASKVGAIENAGELYEAIVLNMGVPVDFSSNKTITAKLWSTTELPVAMKFEGGVNGERENEVVVTHGGTGWEDLTFDYANNATKSYIDGNQGVGEPFVPTGQYATMVIFVDFGGPTAGTFYIDDIVQEGTAVACTEEMDENIDPAAGDINWTFKSKDIDHSFEPFGDIASEIVNNPNPSGINESCNVQSYIKTANCQTWSGVGKGLANAIDLTSAPNKAFKLMVYGESKTTKVTLQLEFEPFPNTDPLVAIDQEMTKVGEWEELTFDFSAHSDKTFKSIIVYFDRDNTCDDAVYYFDNLKQVAGDDNGGGPIGGTGPTTFPIDFETAETGASSKFDVFEADTPPLEVIANPDMSGENTTATVAKFTAPFGGADYAGTVTALKDKFTLDATNSSVSIMVWKSVISDVGIKFESNKASTGEIKIANTKINEWEEIVFDFSGKIGEGSSTDIDAIVVFPDFDARTQDNIVYFDNITLSASSGGGGSGPDSSAPIPSAKASDVKSIFSDAYDDVAGTDFFPNWGQGTTYEQIDLMGDAAIKYANLNYQGIAIGSAVDATGSESIHIDIWSDDYTVVPFFLISAGSGEKSVNLSVEANKWNSIDVPLSAFTDQGLAVNDIIQFKFDVQPNNGGTIYIDNLYFEVNDSGGSASLELPITFDDSSLDYEGLIDGSFSVVDNPAPGGANNVASKVGAIANAGVNWEAIVANMGTAVDFSTDKTIKIKVWSTSSLPILLKFEGGVNGERQNEVSVTHGGTGWEELTFDFATSATKSYIDGNQGVGEAFVPTGQYKTMVIFVDGPGTAAGTFYIDDIIQE
jgi:hypothetical protein